MHHLSLLVAPPPSLPFVLPLLLFTMPWSPSRGHCSNLWDTTPSSHSHCSPLPWPLTCTPTHPYLSLGVNSASPSSRIFEFPTPYLLVSLIPRRLRCCRWSQSSLFLGLLFFPPFSSPLYNLLQHVVSLLLPTLRPNRCRRSSSVRVPP